jgi:hypothetical protein
VRSRRFSFSSPSNGRAPRHADIAPLAARNMTPPSVSAAALEVMPSPGSTIETCGRGRDVRRDGLVCHQGFRRTWIGVPRFLL